jgi:hypothetical protein
VGNLVELLNTVRNRILDFALAIWKESPTAGESDADRNVSHKIEPAKVTQIFNTTVYGGAANLVGAVTNSSVAFEVTQNDIASLEKFLHDNGVDDSDIEELRDAVASDEKPQDGRSFGPRVSSWIGNMAKKAAEGSWKIGVAAAGNLLARAIAGYYGL